MISNIVIELLNKCDEWESQWMPKWVHEEAGELLFYAPDSALLVCVPTPTTLSDIVQFVNNVNQTVDRWVNDQ